MNRIYAIIGLAIALAISIYGNYHQWSTEIAEEAQHATEIRALTAEAALASTQIALARSQGFVDAAAAESNRIDARMTEIAIQQTAVLDSYRRKLADIKPLPPECAPGQERVDAFNDWSTQ